MVKQEVLESFLSDLSSKKPVPGGGGASGVAGALGTALSLMVISLTVGKKKYRAYEEELTAIRDRLEELKEEFLALADRDEEVFLPLSKAYSLPKDTAKEEAYRKKVMGEALKAATEVPLKTMETAVEALKLTKTVAEKGSKLAISDAGCAASFLNSALLGASYNVVINVNSMEEGGEKESYEKRSEALLAEGNELSSRIRETVLERLS